jgi:hypothetical protein
MKKHIIAAALALTATTTPVLAGIGFAPLAPRVASADGIVFEASGGWYGAVHPLTFQRPDGTTGSNVVHVYVRGAQHSAAIRTAQVVPTVRTDARGRATVAVRITIPGGESLQTSAAVRGWDASGRERLLAQRGGGGGEIVLDFSLDS